MLVVAPVTLHMALIFKVFPAWLIVDAPGFVGTFILIWLLVAVKIDGKRLFVPVPVCVITPEELIVSNGVLVGIFNPVELDNKPVQVIVDVLEIFPLASIKA